MSEEQTDTRDNEETSVMWNLIIRRGVGGSGTQIWLFSSMEYDVTIKYFSFRWSWVIHFWTTFRPWPDTVALRKSLHGVFAVSFVHTWESLFWVALYHCVCSIHRFTVSPGENAFQVKITAPDEQFTRVGVQILDRKDGSFIVRYRMYASYKSLKIEVQTKDKHIARSPYILKGTEIVPYNMTLTYFKITNLECLFKVPVIHQLYVARGAGVRFEK